MTARERLEKRKLELGHDPKRSLGQNFLVADHVIEKILLAAALHPANAILEVGPGLGALTDGLKDIPSPRFLLVELDRGLAAYWAKQGFEVVEADALQLDWSTLQLPAGTLLVSNLPYQIAASLVIERSLRPDGVDRMLLMFQKEVAHRLLARAGSEDYGLLTVIAQAYWQVGFLLEAGPRDFWPAPKIASRVVSFRRLSRPFEKDSQDEAFLKFVKAAFAQRRKLLSKNLGVLMPPDQVRQYLESEGLPATARAEELTPQQFLSLFKQIATH